jgi:sugar phosphate isomerase/epimerase
MKKISLSSWAIPMELPAFSEEIKKIGFDGISLGGFKPFGAHPDFYDTPEKRDALKKMFSKTEIEVADYAIDLWSINSLKSRAEWLALYDRFLEFADEMDFRLVRVDTGSEPILPAGMSYPEVKKQVVQNFKQMARKAAAKNIDVLWEFEPGFIVNEPANVIEVVKAVDEPNFKF